MDSLRETMRQLRTSVALISVIALIGVIGFMLLEGLALLDAIYLTVITLTTIGYGDITPQTAGGRLFTLGLIVVGLGAYGFAIQAIINLLLSPTVRHRWLQGRIRREIAELENHFIICDTGQFIDRIAEIMAQSAEIRTQWREAELERKLRCALSPIFGRGPRGPFQVVYRGLVAALAVLARRLAPARDRGFSLVVVTDDTQRAAELREKSVPVVMGSPTEDEILRDAGVERARAMMVTLENDAESLLTVLTARQYNSHMLITAAILTEEMRDKMIRVGANNVILPYEIGGHFLNMATLRPAVSDFFNHILFNWVDQIATEQFPLGEHSPWLGQPLGALQLRQRFDAGVIAIMQQGGEFVIMPPSDHLLQGDEVLVAVCPMKNMHALDQERRGKGSAEAWSFDWQQLPFRMEHPRQYLPDDALPGPEKMQAAIDALAHHFVICADGRAGREAVENLDPSRPFVIITNDAPYADDLLHTGFRVALGNPVHEDVLRQAGVDRALAIMVTLEDEASSVLTVLTARSLSRTLNITAAANNALMENKLKQAGADRVAMPLQIAAQFITLATLRQVVTDFFQYVVFNRQVGIETTELYMQDDSPFIGHTIADTGLPASYASHVIGIRHADGHFTVAPPPDYVMQPHEVIIVVTPMRHADELRVIARGDRSGQLRSIRPGRLGKK